jgi:mRNA-degrading endonuclease RelE of RelBE toxin-antitoxin system
MLAGVRLLMTLDARRDFSALPPVIQQRVRGVSQRLLEWPNVSGAKPMRHDYKGCFRVRTGDWRLICRPVGDEIWVIRIAHRREVYED